MSEVSDIVLPVLQRIQADIAEMKRDLADTKRDLGGKMDALSKRMSEFEGYFTYTMGMTAQHKAAITQVQADVAALRTKVEALEDA